MILINIGCENMALPALPVCVCVGVLLKGSKPRVRINAFNRFNKFGKQKLISYIAKAVMIL